MTNLRLLTALCVALALPVSAQTTEEPPVDHSGMNHAVTGDETPSTVAFMAASTKMHSEMGIAYSGNADVDFIRGMIPHHQGAVDAARIVLEHGTDPDVRKFAESVIAAQEAEIAWMTEWLTKAEQ